jgi:putative membrane protein
MLLHHLIQCVIFAVAVLLTAKIVPGVRVKSFGSALIFAIVLAILNKLLFGLLVFLSLPMIFLTLGLFLLVINAILWMLADKLVSGVELSGFGAAFFASIVTSLINCAVLWLIR